MNLVKRNWVSSLALRKEKYQNKHPSNESGHKRWGRHTGFLNAKQMQIFQKN